MSNPIDLNPLVASVYDVASGVRSWLQWLEELAAVFGVRRIALAERREGGEEINLAEITADPRVVKLPATVLSERKLVYLDGEGPEIVLRFDDSADLCADHWARLAPHVARVTNLCAARVAQPNGAQSSLRALGEALGVGMVLLHRENMSLLYTNAVARDILAQTERLSLGHHTLEVRDHSLRSQLRMAIADVVALRSTNGRHIWVDELAGRYCLLVQRPERWLAELGKHPTADCVVLLIATVTAPHGLLEQRLVDRYALTPKEARTVTGVMQGKSMDELRTLHDLSVHTLRTQLKSAMKKVGVTSQSALIVELSSDPLMLFAGQG